MNDLVYVMYNLKLSGREGRKKKEIAYATEQLETLNIDDIDSDDEWIIEEEESAREYDSGGDEVGEEANAHFDEPNEVDAALFEISD